MIVVEAAVDTLRSALAAERAGVDRLELCASLYDGGTTPSAGLIACVLERVRVPVLLMVRPRGGHFAYSDDEFAVMKRDIELARGSGVAGFVSGILGPDNRIDLERTRVLVDTAGSLPVTFHRAFDLVDDQGDATESLIDAGVVRVLTSGGAASALEGAVRIAELVDHTDGRIRVMAGGGIREHNVRDVISRTGVSEVHTGLSFLAGAGRWAHAPGVRIRKPLPADEAAWSEVDEERMRRLVEVVRSGS